MKANTPSTATGTKTTTPYRTIVATAEGRHYGTYLDWFADDAAAVAGFSEIMAEQG